MLDWTGDICFLIIFLLIIAKKVNIFIELITIFFDSSINLVALEIFLYKNYNSIHLCNDKFFLQTKENSFL